MPNKLQLINVEENWGKFQKFLTKLTTGRYQLGVCPCTIWHCSIGADIIRLCRGFDSSNIKVSIYSYISTRNNRRMAQSRKIAPAFESWGLQVFTKADILFE